MATLPSEAIEPTAGMLLLHWLRNIKEAGNNPHEKERALANLWWGVNALDSLASSLPGAVHFAIAASNEVRRARMVIMGELGIDPTTHPLWKRR